MIRLRPRLAAAAALVRGTGTFVDIGSDHAYLPVRLIQQGTVDSAIAADIGEGPLKNAEKTVLQYGLQDRIILRLSDGLSNILPGEADEIAVCGMGGDLTAGILRAAPWIRRPGQRLVLQPMSHSQDVRRYLCENSFNVEKELCVEDGGRVYLALSAVWTGEKQDKSIGYYYFGDLINTPGTAERFVSKQLRWVHTRLDAISAADRFPKEQAELRAVLKYYDEVKTK